MKRRGAHERTGAAAAGDLCTFAMANTQLHTSSIIGKAAELANGLQGLPGAGPRRPRCLAAIPISVSVAAFEQVCLNTELYTFTITDAQLHTPNGMEKAPELA